MPNFISGFLLGTRTGSSSDKERSQHSSYSEQYTSVIATRWEFLTSAAIAPGVSTQRKGRVVSIPGSRYVRGVGIASLPVIGAFISIPLATITSSHVWTGLPSTVTSKALIIAGPAPLIVRSHPAPLSFALKWRRIWGWRDGQPSLFSCFVTGVD
jgi:hypothetical protein